MPAESIIDTVVAQSLNTAFANEAAAAAGTRTRMWDNMSVAVAGAQLNYINAPSVLAGQGIRMLSGTPGEFGNQVTPK